MTPASKMFAACIIVSVTLAQAAAISSLNAVQPYLRTLLIVLKANWNDAPMPQVIAGKVERESGWRAHAMLKTQRELGRGLAQMTVTYNKNGSERFNVYRDAVKMSQLRTWDWKNDPYNVQYQLTFCVLTDRRNFYLVRPYSKDDIQAWKSGLVCYNAGYGRWLKRRYNAKIMGLDASSWDDGLSCAHTSAEDVVLYGRPLWKVINEYPEAVFKCSTKYIDTMRR